MQPNVSYPWGDGNPPANLPVVDDPVSLFNPMVTFDGTQLALNELMESMDFAPLGDDFSLSIFGE